MSCGFGGLDGERLKFFEIVKTLVNVEVYKFENVFFGKQNISIDRNRHLIWRWKRSISLLNRKKIHFMLSDFSNLKT